MDGDLSETHEQNWFMFPFRWKAIPIHLEIAFARLRPITVVNLVICTSIKVCTIPPIFTRKHCMLDNIMARD